MATKTCITCKQSKDVSFFSKRDTSKDGYRNDCKECRCKRQRAYSKTQAGRLVQQKADKIRHQRFPDRRSARSALFRAIEIGLVKPQLCWVCGESAEAHHPNYSQPLDVVWLCFDHHKEVHNGISG